MTGVGGRPELIIEGTNDLNADDWKVGIYLPHRRNVLLDSQSLSVSSHSPGV